MVAADVENVYEAYKEFGTDNRVKRQQICSDKLCQGCLRNYMIDTSKNLDYNTTNKIAGELVFAG